MIISLMALLELNTTKGYDQAGEENIDCPQLYSLQKLYDGSPSDSHHDYYDYDYNYDYGEGI